jgi:hypothetical protein
MSKPEQSRESHSLLLSQALAEIRSTDARELAQEQWHRRTLCALSYETSDCQKLLR